MSTVSANEDDVDADDRERNVPVYTEKKAVKGLSGAQKRNDQARKEEAKTPAAVPQSKVRISYEVPVSNNSFINIVL